MIVAIEGGDQAGKQTQSAMLRRALDGEGRRVALFHFPDYKTAIGREIRRRLNAVGRTGESAPPQVIHCLLAANRWERLNNIRKAAEENDVLVMDRYYHSNIVYGLANGIKRPWLEKLEEGLPRPDLTILLDMSLDESLRRKRVRRDRFESNKELQRRIFSTYRAMARDGRNWTVIDASRSRQEVHNQILEETLRRLRRRG